MFLVKCKCGCFFTIKAESLSTAWLSCQNCSARIPFVKGTEIGECRDLLNATESISCIPDNAKITVTFDA